MQRRPIEEPPPQPLDPDFVLHLRGYGLDDEEAPRIRKSASCFTSTDTVARKPPMASDPASPMNTCAGYALNHRNPTAAPRTPRTRRPVRRRPAGAGRTGTWTRSRCHDPGEEAQRGHRERGRHDGEAVQAVGDVHGVAHQHDEAEHDGQVDPPGRGEGLLHERHVQRTRLARGSGDHGLARNATKTAAKAPCSRSFFASLIPRLPDRERHFATSSERPMPANQIIAETTAQTYRSSIAPDEARCEDRAHHHRAAHRRRASLVERRRTPVSRIWSTRPLRWRYHMSGHRDEHETNANSAAPIARTER